MKTFRISTLGCKVNQYDSELIRESLLAADYAPAGEDGRSADLCVINTCAVTQTSEAKSRRAVARAVRENPSAAIVVTGCCAELDRDAWAAMPGVHLVLGNAAKERIAEALGAQAPPPRMLRHFARHARAFVKIQDGCDAFCSYCVVPITRGRSRSRPLGEIVAEASALASSGHGEIVLCGINLGAYGRDLGEERLLILLLRELIRSCAAHRIRLSSIESEDVSDDLLDLMASGGKLCPHLHIPLQSGDAEVLRAMNRSCSAQRYAELVTRVRERMPDASLTTDIMVGFPTETDDAFDRTIAMVEYAGFSRVHIFPYSPRRGTAAWELGDPVPPEIKEQRRAILLASAGRTARDYRKKFLGRRVEALIQGAGGAGRQQGLTREYLRVSVRGGVLPAGSLCTVLVTGLTSEGLDAETTV